jgi:hypothetical protein
VYSEERYEENHNSGKRKTRPLPRNERCICARRVRRSRRHRLCSLPVSRCLLEPRTSFRILCMSSAFYGSPVLMGHVRFILLQTCHFCLHEFVVRGKLLAPPATRGPRWSTSEPITRNIRGKTTHFSSPAFRLLPSFLWASRAVDRLGMDNKTSGPGLYE